MGAEPAQENAVQEGASCHAMPSHDGVSPHFSGPHGMMKDCPLRVNATAATSKSSAHLPGPGRDPVQASPDLEKQSIHTQYTHAVPILHNRGSTHLQCCVFLI